MSDQEAKTPDYYYAKSDDEERWTCQDSSEVAEESFSILCHWNESNADQPVEGYEVEIYRGESDKVVFDNFTWGLEENITDWLYQEVGEAAEYAKFPDGIEDKFIDWLKTGSGIELNCFKIHNITPIKMVFRDGDWVEVGDE